MLRSYLLWLSNLSTYGQIPRWSPFARLKSDRPVPSWHGSRSPDYSYTGSFARARVDSCWRLQHCYSTWSSGKYAHSIFYGYLVHYFYNSEIVLSEYKKQVVFYHKKRVFYYKKQKNKKQSKILFFSFFWFFIFFYVQNNVLRCFLHSLWLIT